MKLDARTPISSCDAMRSCVNAAKSPLDRLFAARVSSMSGRETVAESMALSANAAAIKASAVNIARDIMRRISCLICASDARISSSKCWSVKMSRSAPHGAVLNWIGETISITLPPSSSYSNNAMSVCSCAARSRGEVSMVCARSGCSVCATAMPEASIKMAYLRSFLPTLSLTRCNMAEKLNAAKSFSTCRANALARLFPRSIRLSRMRRLRLLNSPCKTAVWDEICTVVKMSIKLTINDAIKSISFHLMLQRTRIAPSCSMFRLGMAQNAYRTSRITLLPGMGKSTGKPSFGVGTV